MVWTIEARADRRAIFDYILAENPSAALALDETISRRIQDLRDHPQLGPPGRVAGTRELVVHPSYVVVYLAGRGAVTILRILHTSRRWPPG